MKSRFWNIFFTLVFLAIIGILYMILSGRGLLNMRFDFYELFFMTLATQRLTRLFVYDKIMLFFREIWQDTGWQKSVKDLLSCPWCVGMWFAPFVLFFYLLNPAFMIAYIVLAIASLASILQVLINAFGHWGEKCSYETERLKK